MLKWPKTALGWIHLFWMGAAGAIVITIGILFVQLIVLKSDIKQDGIRRCSLGHVERDPG
jgi:uncharacterized membrane protein